MDYLNKQCGNCGAPLDGIVAVDGVVECAHCHSKFTVARSGDKNVLDFLAIGEHEADVGDFDKARAAYAKAAELDKSEPSAYWGMALADFRVRFLRDEVNDRLQPICYEISQKSFSEDENFKRALACATNAQREEYMRIAHEIDYIRSEFYRFQKEGVDYDCFICVKVTDDDTKRKTPDSDRANDLYYHLRDRGYKPFYSEREIQNKQGADYEARILYALYSSETMIIVCGDEEYLQTKWVKNEYMRFIGLIRNDEKEYDSITIAYFDKPIDKLPGRDGRLQGVCLNSPDAYSKLIDFVDAHYRSGFVIPDIVRKSYGAMSYGKNSAVKTKLQKRRLDSLGGSAEISVSDNSVLKNAADFLLRGDFANAVKFAQILIANNPANFAAYEVYFLAENRCKSKEEYESSSSRTPSFDNLEKAIAVATDAKAKGRLYGMLYNRVKNTRDLDAYSEFITLPDSTEKQISELTAIMYEAALGSGDESVFSSVIQTVGDVDLFIKMNVEFARSLNGGTPFFISKVAPYYRDVLEKADAGHAESLWYVYLADRSISKLPEYFCDQNNFADIESGLFSYGYNSFAADLLFDICFDEVSRKNEKAVGLLNFLLSMIPAEKNTEYCKRLRSSVERFMAAGSFANAKHYNDMYLAANGKDDTAHLNACLINHKMNNPVSLLRLGNALLDDPEFRAAFDLYPENHPGENNLYMDIYMFVQDNIDLVAVRDAFSDFEKEMRIGLMNIRACRNEIIEFYRIKSEDAWRNILKKYDCYSFDDMMRLTCEIEDEPRFAEAYLHSVAHEYCIANDKTKFIPIDNPYGSGKIPYKKVRIYTCDSCDGKGFVRNAGCPDCGGNGRGRKTCSFCEGNGYVTFVNGGPRHDCRRCHGTGKINSGVCPTCDGKGVRDVVCTICGGSGLSKTDVPIYACVEYISKHKQEIIERNKVLLDIKKCQEERETRVLQKNSIAARKVEAKEQRRPFIVMIIFDIIFCGGALAVLLTRVVTSEDVVPFYMMIAFAGVATLAGGISMKSQRGCGAAAFWAFGGILFITLCILIIVTAH